MDTECPNSCDKFKFLKWSPVVQGMFYNCSWVSLSSIGIWYVFFTGPAWLYTYVRSWHICLAWRVPTIVQERNVKLTRFVNMCRSLTEFSSFHKRSRRQRAHSTISFIMEKNKLTILNTGPNDDCPNYLGSVECIRLTSCLILTTVGSNVFVMTSIWGIRKLRRH